MHPASTRTDAAISIGVAEPSVMRTGIARADENGRIEATRAIVDPGSCTAPIEMNRDARINRFRETITFRRSSIRETSEPATAKSEA